MNYDRAFIKELARVLPPFFVRADAQKVTYGTITPGYLSFLASKGRGPAYTMVGSKALYRRDDFINWLMEKRHGEQFNISDGDFGRTAHAEQVPAEIFAGTARHTEE